MTDPLAEFMAVMLMLGTASLLVWAALEVPFRFLDHIAEIGDLDFKPVVAWCVGSVVAWMTGLDPLVPLGADPSILGYVLAGAAIATGAKGPHKIAKRVRESRP